MANEDRDGAAGTWIRRGLWLFVGLVVLWLVVGIVFRLTAISVGEGHSYLYEVGSDEILTQPDFRLADWVMSDGQHTPDVGWRMWFLQIGGFVYAFPLGWIEWKLRSESITDPEAMARLAALVETNELADGVQIQARSLDFAEPWAFTPGTWEMIELRDPDDRPVMPAPATGGPADPPEFHDHELPAPPP